MNTIPNVSDERSAVLIRALSLLPDTHAWAALQVLALPEENVLATLTKAVAVLDLEDLRDASGELRSHEISSAVLRELGVAEDLSPWVEGSSLTPSESDRWNELVADFSCQEFSVR